MPKISVIFGFSTKVHLVAKGGYNRVLGSVMVNGLRWTDQGVKEKGYEGRTGNRF